MDNGFDPCECVNSAHWAMQRLLAILRNSQQNCNDIECFPNQQLGSDDGDGGMMMIMMAMWVIFIIGIFISRPASLRGSDTADKRSRGGPSNNGNGRDPDVPPVQ